MREKNKKVGYSCYEKKMRGFEKPKEKYKRWRRNIKFAYQRIRYGYCDSDIWSIDYWFLNVMPGMLQQLKETTHSYPCFQGSISHAVYGTAVSEDADDAGMKQWDEILSEMIFLLKESNEDTCTRENKYQKEYDKAQEEFDDKYGMFGEKLRTEAEKAEEKKKGTHRIYMLGDVPCQTANYGRRFQRIVFGDFSSCTAQSVQKHHIPAGVAAHFRRLVSVSQS